MNTTKTKNALNALIDFEKNHIYFPKSAISAMHHLIVRIGTMSGCEIEAGPFISCDKSVCTKFRKGDKEIIVSANSRFINIDEKNYIGAAQCIKRFGKTHTESAAYFINEYLNK